VCQIASKYNFIQDGGPFVSSRCLASYYLLTELSEVLVFNIDMLIKLRWYKGSYKSKNLTSYVTDIKFTNSEFFNSYDPI
jgi:hypothetical protein